MTETIKPKIRVIPNKDYSEFHITLDCQKIQKEHLSKTLESIRQAGINITRITGVGNMKLLQQFDYLSEYYPLILIGNLRKIDFDQAGFIINGVQGRLDCFKYIKEEEIMGSYFSVGGDRYLFVKGSTIKSLHSVENFEEDAKNNYSRLKQYLTRNGFTTQNIYRYWNYMENINSHYKTFNKVRDEHFQKEALVDYPAATGIEACLPNGNINISLKAVQIKNKNKFRIDTLHSDLQCDATCYGPKFSRAKIAQRLDAKIIYVSGTSNVNREGKSVVLDDLGANINYVFDCVGNLLSKGNLTVSDIASSIIYCKNKKILDLFLKHYTKNNWQFPYLVLMTDICRPNFFF